MPHEILALQCPKCGNAADHKKIPAKFGYQFHCNYCGTGSVLIANQFLHIARPGEHVCTVCGLIARPDARFCQCGASLIRKCPEPSCFKEVPSDHAVCDYCGWPADLDPESPAGQDEEWRRVAKDLHSPDRDLVHTALWELAKNPGHAAAKHAAANVPVVCALIEKNWEVEMSCELLVVAGSAAAAAAVPALQTALKVRLPLNSYDLRETLPRLLGAIATIGPAAAPLIPILTTYTQRYWSDEETTIIRGLAFALVSAGALDSALAFLTRIIEGNAFSTDQTEAAFQALEQIGAPALPVVRNMNTFRSWFGPRWRFERAKAAQSKLESLR